MVQVDFIEENIVFLVVNYGNFPNIIQNVIVLAMDLDIEIKNLSVNRIFVLVGNLVFLKVVVISMEILDVVVKENVLENIVEI